ncbi:MAG: helix-turn-helix transcriptional regulator [Deltaproteobacteria bacterium HGW-Deltaproteobacteria-15]|jgi:LuxR family transcriptional regulator of csgAB operon|nr:MAG: helix-turn-helix transcriptional regulator [Deltaproteobacteria bacterium HGW-Deltaproteobacteria-15]
MKVQNSLLAFYLKEAVGMNCTVAQSVTEIPQVSEEEADAKRLVLLDCIGNDLSASLEKLSRNFFVCLFNLNPNSGVEEESVAKGVRGFFYLEDTIEQLLNGVRAIFNGEMWLSRKTMTSLILANQKERFSSLAKSCLRLTRREKEILIMIAEGATNSEIADKLFISKHTVKTHTHNIFKKINASSRSQAAMWAVKNL